MCTAQLGVDMILGDRPGEPACSTGVTESYRNTIVGFTVRVFDSGTIEMGHFENWREAEPLSAFFLGRELWPAQTLCADAADLLAIIIFRIISRKKKISC